jgi:hypothetical protein
MSAYVYYLVYEKVIYIERKYKLKCNICDIAGYKNTLLPNEKKGKMYIRF